MARKKQYYPKQDDLAGRPLSMGEAWTIAEGIMGVLRFYDDHRFKVVGARLDCSNNCIGIKAKFRNADISEGILEEISGLEYFVGVAQDKPESSPYAIYSVPYNPAKPDPAPKKI